SRKIHKGCRYSLSKRIRSWQGSSVATGEAPRQRLSCAYKASAENARPPRSSQTRCVSAGTRRAHSLSSTLLPNPAGAQISRNRQRASSRASTRRSLGIYAGGRRGIVATCTCAAASVLSAPILKLADMGGSLVLSIHENAVKTQPHGILRPWRCAFRPITLHDSGPFVDLLNASELIHPE